MKNRSHLSAVLVAILLLTQLYQVSPTPIIRPARAGVNVGISSISADPPNATLDETSGRADITIQLIFYNNGSTAVCAVYNVWWQVSYPSEIFPIAERVGCDWLQPGVTVQTVSWHATPSEIGVGVLWARVNYADDVYNGDDFIYLEYSVSSQTALYVEFVSPLDGAIVTSLPVELKVRSYFKYTGDPVKYYAPTSGATAQFYVDGDFKGFSEVDGDGYAVLAVGSLWIGYHSWSVLVDHDLAPMGETGNATFFADLADLFDFAVKVSGDISVEQGGSIVTTVGTDLLTAWSETVSLSCSGLPFGVSCLFDPSSGSPSFTSQLTVSTNSSAAVGNHIITVVGSWGELTRSTTFTLTVKPPFKLGLSVSYNAGSHLVVLIGGSSTATIAAALLSGWSETVSLSCSGLPFGVSCLFDPSSGSPSFTSQLTVSTNSSVVAGWYDLTVIGTKGEYSVMTNVALHVVEAGGLTVTASSPSVYILRGGSGTTTVRTSFNNQYFPEHVSLSCSGLPFGVRCSFNPSSTWQPSSVDLTISTNIRTPIGKHRITVVANGTSGSLHAQTSFMLAVYGEVVFSAFGLPDPNAEFCVSISHPTWYFTSQLEPQQHILCSRMELTHPFLGSLAYSYLQVTANGSYYVCIDGCYSDISIANFKDASTIRFVATYAEAFPPRIEEIKSTYGLNSIFLNIDTFSDFYKSTFYVKGQLIDEVVFRFNGQAYEVQSADSSTGYWTSPEFNVLDAKSPLIVEAIGQYGLKDIRSVDIIVVTVPSWFRTLVNSAGAKPARLGSGPFHPGWTIGLDLSVTLFEKEKNVGIPCVSGRYGAALSYTTFVEVSSSGDASIGAYGTFEITVRNVRGEVEVGLSGVLRVENRQLVAKQLSLWVAGSVDYAIVCSFEFGFKRWKIGAEVGFSIGGTVKATLNLEVKDGGRILGAFEVSGGVLSLTLRVRAWGELSLIIFKARAEVGGELRIAITFPQRDFSLGLGAYIKITVTFLKFIHISFTFRIEWPKGGGSAQLVPLSTPEPTWTERTWLGTGYSQYAWIEGETEGIYLSKAYPYANPIAAISPSGTRMMVWTHDDPSKDNPKGYEIYYSTWDDALKAWKQPSAVTSDEYIDIDPVLAFLPNGDAVLLWTRVPRPVDLHMDPLDVPRFSEIAYSIWDSVNARWSKPSLLTDNHAIDYKPRICASTKPLAAWFESSDDFPDGLLNQQIYYSEWKDGSWSNPKVIASDILPVSDLSIACDGEDAVVSWAADTDGNMTSTSDFDVFYARIRNGFASSPIRVTSNNNSDTGPAAFYDPNGEPHLVWVKETGSQTITILNILTGETIDLVERPLVSSPTIIFGEGGRKAIIWLDGAVQKPYASIFNPDSGSWTNATTIVAPDLAYLSPSLGQRSNRVLLTSLVTNTTTGESSIYAQLLDYLLQQPPTTTTTSATSATSAIPAISPTTTIPIPTPTPRVSISITALVLLVAATAQLIIILNKRRRKPITC